MDDDAALTQVLAANDELTLAVNAYKERVGRRECNGGRERSGSEEMEGKNNGRSIFFSVNGPLENTLTLCLAPLCAPLILSLLVPAAQRSPREIKSYHLIDFSALDSPPTHRKADSSPPFKSSSPMFSPLLEDDQDFNELGRPTFYTWFALS